MKIVILTSLMLLFGCCPQRLLDTSTLDSTRVEIVNRLVLVKDSVRIEITPERESAQLPIDSTSTLENSFAISHAEVLGGHLFHSLETKPQTIEKEIVVETTARDSIIYRDKVVTKVVEVERDLNFWQEFQIWLGRCAMLVLFVYLILKRYI